MVAQANKHSFERDLNIGNRHRTRYLQAKAKEREVDSGRLEQLGKAMTTAEVCRERLQHVTLGIELNHHPLVAQRELLRHLRHQHRLSTAAHTGYEKDLLSRRFLAKRLYDFGNSRCAWDDLQGLPAKDEGVGVSLHDVCLYYFLLVLQHFTTFYWFI